MAAGSSIASKSSASLHFNPPSRFLISYFNPISYLAIPKHKHGCFFPSLHRVIKTERDFSVHDSVQPGPPLPSKPPSDSWRGWILGMVVTIILPFFSNKWGPLVKWTKQVGDAIETVEKIVDTVEDVAESVDKVAENVGDDLPEGGKLQSAASLVEDFAEKVAKGAHVTGEFIDKVEEVQDKVEVFVEPDTDQAKDVTKQAKEAN